MTIAEALRTSRNSTGKSQEYMAYELHVSRRTILNWENGISEPTIGQAITWFRLVEKNPIPYLLQHVFPDMDKISEKDSDDRIRTALLALINELPMEGVRQLLYLFYGDHGSSPRAVLQMLNAHLQTPLKDRVSHGSLIATNYDMARRTNNIARPNHIQPDYDYLMSAIDSGKMAVARNSEEYIPVTDK